MSVATKNLYDLLGNDDGDSDTPSGPVKTVDKTSTHTTKRNTDGLAPAKAAPTGPSGTRRGGGAVGNDAAFRDRAAGHDRNRGKPTDEAARDGHRGGQGARVRGGRGGRYPRDRDDRHTKGAPHGGSDKTASQTWGATEGDAELKDEQAGENIAQTEQKEAIVEDAAADRADAEPAEPEDKSVSYSDYLAQQAEKKLQLGEDLQLRKPNEGVKENKKWATAKELVKDDDDEFISGTGGKIKRERERKTKQIVEIDNRYVEPERPRGGARGGRGGPRGDRGERGDFGGRGGSRGDRSDRGDRGERGERGDFAGRGGRGERGDRGDRGGPRGGRGGPRGDFRGGRGGGRGADGAQLNTSDESAFPSLGK